MNKHMKSICSAVLCGCLVVGSNSFAYGAEATTAAKTTEQSSATEQTTTAESTTTAAGTEATTTAQQQQETTAQQQTTTHKDKKTEQKKKTAKTSKKKAKKIKQKNKVKKLKKDKKLKEEKVVSNIIPKVYNDTRLSMKDKKETIAGFIYFNQGDAAWNQNGYCIKSSGCGPTAMAVCISSLTKKWVTPLDTTIWAYEHGYYSNAGSVHEVVPALAKNYQLGCNGLGTDYKKIRDALKKKHPVVGLMGPGYFTKGGHFIALVAIDDKDQVTVADVGSRQRSTYKYRLKDVIEQSKAASAGGPFWEIYKPGKAEKATLKAKKAKAQAKETKEQLQKKHRYNDLKAVLSQGQSVIVPLKQGAIVSKESFVTLLDIDAGDQVSVEIKEEESREYPLKTIVDELQTKAIGQTFWEMTHPMEKSQGPTLSDFLKQ
ncbi:C39 family peptidase [Anaerostipes rhamnosivorans]|uniref:Glutamate synthase [NADPH] large chain n=1 Tax=Anaerostipes rhamnosivorans TaxID=1229621 RepID=A0A4P8I9Y9_9FIRM|nr:C39 family peptidase [Anaerostipes rhamnosivorans]QCP34392.1 Glutamate synthase [NADPH] large chain [Anaerostipes rhamnosivorans]